MEITVRHTIVLDHLELGNNFQTRHLMDALVQHEDVDEMMDYINEIECDSEVTIMADIKFNHHITETFAAIELGEMLDKAYNELNDEEGATVCLECNTEIENGKLYCSEECMKNNNN